MGRTAGSLLTDFQARFKTVDGRPIDQVEADIQAIFQDFRRGRAAPVEVELDDGTWLAISRHPTSDGGFVVLRSDITEAKKFERELQNSERRLRVIVESHPVPLFVIDVETGRYIYESPAAARLLGHEWPPQKDYFARDNYADADARLDFVQRLRESDHVTDFEVAAKRTDGSQIWASLSAQRIELDGREAAIVSLADLTERKERETELRHARELLEDAIESLPEGFVVFDADDRLVTCNRQYAVYNEPHRHLLVPGTKWRDLTRIRAEQGFFKDAIGRVEPWLDEEEENRKTSFRREVPVSGDRWFILSNRRTRQGGTVILWQDITERRRMEEALRESEELIRRVVEDCPLPILMTRAKDGKVLYESPSSRTAFGISPTDPVGPAGERFADPTIRRHYLEALNKTGALDEYIVDFRRLDGSGFIGAVSARLVKYHGVEVIVATTVDVTEARNRERQLRLARELLEDAIESLSEGFALYDADDRLVMCNQRYRDQNPMTAELLVPGVKWIDFVREGAKRGQYVGAAEDVVGFVESRLEDRRGLKTNLEFQQTDGHWFQFSNQRTRQGGIVVTRTDITERKAMEEALRESEALVRRVLEAHPIPVGMSRIDDGLLLYESPGLKRVLGREGKPTRTISAKEFYADPNDRVTYIDTLKKTGEVDDLKVRFKRVDGSEFWASVSGRMLDYKGEEVSVFSTVDLTEKLAAEEELEQQRKALYQSEKMSALGSLLAGVAHELNNPLSIVVGQALMLEEAANDPRITERAAKIGRAADRCARIVKTFLAMARDQKPTRAWVNLNEIVHSALEVVGYSLRQDNVDIALDLGPDLPPTWGDGDQLTQVIANIALNAQQALRETSGPRTLRIETAYDSNADRIRLTIADNGPGIPATLQTRIFDPFFTTKPVGSGTGIGLAFCQRIIDAHGGAINVRSRPGEGATFFIELSPGEGDPSAEENVVPASAEAKDLRVLVVDDEPEVAAMLGEMLENLGHHPQVVTSGRDAMEHLAHHDVDVILSDLRMPGVDGPKLFDWLGTTRPDLIGAIAFMTGDHLSASAKEFLAASGRPFVEKPVLPGDLRDLLHAVRVKAPRPDVDAVSSD
jgi:PAS domain S-box-containing protein